MAVPFDPQRGGQTNIQESYNKEAWEVLLAIRRQGLRLGRFEQQSEQKQRKFLQGGVPDSFLDASNAT